MPNQNTQTLRDRMLAVMADVNAQVAEREELVEAIAIALLTRKNLFILGAPGQAKSYAINQFRARITGARQFERLLSKQTDEEQLFGRIDLSSLLPGSVPESELQRDPTYNLLRSELEEVMKRLPADTPGMLIVQHMPKGFTQMYADRLNRLCHMEVREAKHGDEIRRGLALLAPADYQMRVVRSGTRYTVSCIQGGEKVSGHRPSVDALFMSMAEQVRCKMVGIIMTGMGRDGADGLLKMRQAGAYTIGQDKESCVVYGMPMVAQNIGAVQIQASCENISSVLLRHLNQV